MKPDHFLAGVIKPVLLFNWSNGLIAGLQAQFFLAHINSWHAFFCN